MASRSRTSIVKTRIEGAIPMARFSIFEDEDDVPIANKRPRFFEPAASQSHAQRSVHRSRSQTQPQTQTRVAPEEGEEEDLIPVDDVDSDSQWFEEAEDEDDEEFEAEEEEDEAEDIGSEEEDDDDDDEEAGAEAEHNHRQEQNHHQQPSSQLGQGNFSGLSRCSSAVAPVVNNNASGALQVMLTDPDVLDCPICLEPLCTPIFQCENGHIACSLCCSKVKRKCPSCCMPIGYNRCRAIEKVVESVRVACKNTRFGCKETMSYSQKTEHEQACPLATCFCPHPSCTFASSSKNLYLHFGIQHAASTIRFTYNTAFSLCIEISKKHTLLQEQHESVIFILNHGIQGHGRVFNIDCIGPSILKGAFVYQLTAECIDTTLSLQSVPEIHTKWSEHTPTKKYLTVPSEFSGYSGLISLRVCIKKAASAV